MAFARGGNRRPLEAGVVDQQRGRGGCFDESETIVQPRDTDLEEHRGARRTGSHRTLSLAIVAAYGEQNCGRHRGRQDRCQSRESLLHRSPLRLFTVPPAPHRRPVCLHGVGARPSVVCRLFLEVFHGGLHLRRVPDPPVSVVRKAVYTGPSASGNESHRTR